MQLHNTNNANIDPLHNLYVMHIMKTELILWFYTFSSKY